MDGKEGPSESRNDAALLALTTAAAQARREALLARAERRRWRRQSGGRPAALLAFPPTASLRTRYAPSLDIGPRPESCQWLYGDGPFADADKCGAPAVAGQSYCRAHLPRLFLMPDDTPEHAQDDGADAAAEPVRTGR